MKPIHHARRRPLRASGVSDPLPVRLPDSPRDLTEPRWAHVALPSALGLRVRPLPVLEEMKLPSLKLLENRKLTDD